MKSLSVMKRRDGDDDDLEGLSLPALAQVTKPGVKLEISGLDFLVFQRTCFRTCLLLHLSFFHFLSCFHSILNFQSPQTVKLQIFSPVLLISTDNRQQPFLETILS